MTTKVTVPQLGESVVEATVGKWLVTEGQEVKKDQPLVELLTDKADSEIPAPASGVVQKLVASEDDTVSVGDTLCEIEEGASGASERSVGGTTTRGDNGRGAAASDLRTSEVGGNDESAVASPLVRKLAREKGVELSAVAGTGRGARITRDDVLRAAQGGKAQTAHVEGDLEPSPKPPEHTPARATARGAVRPATAPMRLTDTGPMGAFKLPPYVPREGDEVVPFTRRRRIIADHMLFSKQTSPEVVTLAECDLHATSRLRAHHKADAKKAGYNLTFLSFVSAAVCRALRDYPELNARVLDDAYVRLRDINLGIAVDTEDGLIVPVIPNADELTVRGLSRAIDDMARRARDRNLSPDDLANKTFTVSNPGRQGNLVGGAILSQPNVGILRMGTIKKRVVVVEVDGDDLMAIHPVMHLALTYDHRIVDGVQANGFLYRVVEILEQADFDV